MMEPSSVKVTLADSTIPGMIQAKIITMVEISIKNTASE